MEKTLSLLREFGPDTDLRAERPAYIEGPDDGWYECRKCGDIYHVDEVHSTQVYSDDPEDRPTCDPNGYPPVHTPDGGRALFVAVYSVGQAYGGPEEGGWWWEYGELERVFTTTDREQADHLVEVLKEVYPNTGRSSSVLGGEDYRVHITSTLPVKNYPTERPHYC